MKIEILYFEGCPNHPPAVSRVRGVIEELGVDEGVTEVEITGPEMARVIGFLGSPSVRVNGLDVELSARNSDQVGFGCRTYWDGTSRSGLPPVEMIRRAIEEGGPGIEPPSLETSQGLRERHRGG